MRNLLFAIAVLLMATATATARPTEHKRLDNGKLIIVPTNQVLFAPVDADTCVLYMYEDGVEIVLNGKTCPIQWSTLDEERRLDCNSRRMQKLLQALVREDLK